MTRHARKSPASRRTLGSLAAVIAYLSAQKYFERGMSAGALK